MQVEVPTHVYSNITPDTKSGWGHRSRPVVAVVDQLLSTPDQAKTSSNIICVFYLLLHHLKTGIYQNLVCAVDVITLYQQSWVQGRVDSLTNDAELAEAQHSHEYCW